MYASDVRPAAELLPATAASAVMDSLAAAGAVAAALPDSQGDALLAVARSAFVDGMGVAVYAGAAVAVVGAVVGLALLPGRTAARAAATAPPRETGPALVVEGSPARA